MLAPADIDRLRDDLLAADFTLDAVSARLGDAALAGLARNSTMAASRALGGSDDPQADAIRLWLLQQPVPAARLRSWGSLAGLTASGLVSMGGSPAGDEGRGSAGEDEGHEGAGEHARHTSVGESVRATVELKPHGSERREGWICSDQTPLDGRLTRPGTDFVLGASPASTTLTQLVPPRRFARALDLGTGCGIQALHLDAGHLVATDLNPRALALARISLGLSGVDADLREGSLYEPVARERFDLILTNPPYVISPPSTERLVYRDGGFAGDDLMREVVSGSRAHLEPDGLLVVLGNWAVTDRPWQDRLAEWLRPTGCDALVLQRERLDPYEYVELWLADAGLTGTPEYSRRYSEWLDYFAAAGIEGVGMGWLALRNAGRAEPELRLEEWPHAVHQPVGTAFDGFFGAIDAARLPDAEVLGRCWRVHPEVIQETLGAPGAADPQHLVLRQQFGFGRAVEAGTALAAVVGACDGDLPLGLLVGAVAGLLDADPDALRDDVLPQVRRLVADGYLLPG